MAFYTYMLGMGLGLLVSKNEGWQISGVILVVLGYSLLVLNTAFPL